jgi:heme A synthase
VCLYCSISLLLLVTTALIGGLSILYPLHWVLAAVDQATGMLFFASMVGLAVWSRMTSVELPTSREVNAGDGRNHIIA